MYYDEQLNGLRNRHRIPPAVHIITAALSILTCDMKRVSSSTSIPAFSRSSRNGELFVPRLTFSLSVCSHAHSTGRVGMYIPSSSKVIIPLLASRDMTALQHIFKISRYSITKSLLLNCHF